MGFEQTSLAGVILIEPEVFEDNRGSFFESWNERVFSNNGIAVKWVQDNQSSSAYGVVRGFHYQLPPFAQSKLIRVLRGKILDVVVDIRKGSPTYGKSYSQELSAKNKRQLFIPAGFAHGFSVLSEKADVLYKCDQFYNKQSEGGILYNDPELAIDWQLPSEAVIISGKDASLPRLADSLNSFEYRP